MVIVSTLAGDHTVPSNTSIEGLDSELVQMAAIPTLVLERSSLKANLTIPRIDFRILSISITIYTTNVW